MTLELQLLWRRLKRTVCVVLRGHRYEGRWHGWRWILNTNAPASSCWLRRCTRCDHAEIAYWTLLSDKLPRLEFIGFEGPAWQTPPLFPPNGPAPEPEVSVGAYR